MTYKETLDAAWQEHLAPRAPDAPTVISTFAGAGGSSLGYSMAGFRELLAVEWDDNAVATFKLNFPDVPVYHGDIGKLTVADVLKRTGLKPGELDVFDGSPPCQGFSTAGKRDFGDARNQLFREYVRLLRGLKPKVFVMENVSGMVKGDMKLIFAEVLRELKASGYRVKARLLNAMYFGVPQSRERMIFIGVREDLAGKEPSHPSGETKPITVREAFRAAPNDGTGGRVGPHTKIWHGMRGVKPGEQQPGHFSRCRLAWDTSAPTVQKANGLAHYHVWHPSEHRVIMLSECKRIGSFPDQFQMAGKIGEAWDRIGNSVPPLFMRSIARHVRREFLTTSRVTSSGAVSYSAASAHSSAAAALVTTIPPALIRA